MKPTRVRYLRAIVGSIALAISAAGFAQSQSQPAPSASDGTVQGPGAAAAPRSDHGPRAWGDPTARVAKHLDRLKTKLKITPDQAGAWQAYATQVTQQVAAWRDARDHSPQGNASAVDRMAQRSAQMQQRAAAMAQATQAFTALYAVLTPEQKAVADRSVARFGHRGMHHRPDAS
jgi:hypothetical protein